MLAVALPVSAAKPASKKLTPPSQHAATHTVAASQAASEAEEMSLASVSRTNPFEIVPAAGMELLSEPGQSEESAALTADMLGFAKRFMGTRYVHGGRSPKGFDCSGFTSYVYANFGYTLSPSSSCTAKGLAVQEIADAISRFNTENGHAGSPVAVMVKNPVNPDLELWIGAIARLYNAGITHITAVHRGFSAYGLKSYRNAPHWHIPIELHRRIPTLQILCDPSHIGGRRELIAPLSQEALDIRFDGLIIETHCDPVHALSDSAQQITPDELRHILASLSTRRNTVASEELTRLRGALDQLDDQLIDILSRRMAIAREIGALKKVNDMTVVQPQRYEQLMASRIEQAQAAGLPAPFMQRLFSTIHAESVAQQARILNTSGTDL